MKMYSILAAGAALLVSGTMAYGKNELVLMSPQDYHNMVSVAMAGDANTLEIMQEHTGTGAANAIVANIEGSLNGGPLGSAFAGAAARSGLKPGTMTQIGHDNAMTVSAIGLGNLFAFAQSGSGNRLAASITGQANQAAVTQQGMNNHAAFSQNGTGNMVSITQRSW
jgi:hypothetical protein